MSTLTDSYSKTARAKEHLDALKRELTIFEESQPYSFAVKTDIEQGLYRIKPELKDPPARLSLIAGDIFTCLRASLDQLVWWLATNATQKYARGTQFPILEKLTSDTRKTFRDYTKGVPADAVAIIESLQPYHGGDTASIRAHMLWRLNALCNIDKHRRVPLHSGVVGFQLSSNIPKEMVTLDNNDEIVLPLSMKDKVKFHPEVTLDVIFGDSTEGIQCALSGLEAMYEFVANDVIPRFTRFDQ